MIPTDQKVIHDPKNGKTGDCLSAVLASLLHLPIENVPLFVAEDTWVKDMNAWLRQYGLAFVNFQPADGESWLSSFGIEGLYHDASGPSPRHSGWDHATVGLDGKVLFDPHPSKDGLNSITHHGVFIVLEPWRMVS